MARIMVILLLPIRVVHLALWERKTKGFPRKTMFDTLILPEMDLVKFVSRVRNLKLPTVVTSTLSMLRFLQMHRIKLQYMSSGAKKTPIDWICVSV